MALLETSQLRLATDAMALVSSVSVGLAFLWVLYNVRRRVGPRLRLIALLCIFIVITAASNLLRDTASFYPAAWLGWLSAVAAAASMAMALALWRFIPAVTREPTHNELLTANSALRSERDARLAAVEKLSQARIELEQRVEERTAALDLVRLRFEIALQGTGIVVAHQDRDLRYTWMYNAPPPLRGREVIGLLPQEILPADLAEEQAKIKNRVLETGEAAKFEAVYTTPTGPIWYEGRVEPLVVDGRLEGVMTVSIDVTKHMLHERQMRHVMRELTHRSKNLLAVVQGVARQSAAGATDIRMFIDGFDARLEALSRAHEMLIDTNWRGVSLRSIIDRELAPLASRLQSMKIEGPDIQLSPEAAQNFALAVNELSADVRRAGSTTAIDLDVRWRTDGDNLQFDWRRHGGAEGAADGFGRNLLIGVLPRQIGGRAQLFQDGDAWVYELQGRAALLAPMGRRALADNPDD